MHQSSTPNLQRPQPDMKKKIIIALMAVAVGHIGVLWGVSQIKTAELKPIEKKPIKVKLVKIKEEFVPPPPPPPPTKPIKPKVEPKPEPIPVVKPKVIAQKNEKTKEKVIFQDDTLEKQKLEKDRLEKDRLERDRQKREQDERDRQKREQDERDRQKREQDERDRQKREQDENSKKPRMVSEGDVSWSRRPIIDAAQVVKWLKPEDGVKTIKLEITSDGTGKVMSVKLLQGSGFSSLDSYVVKQTNAAKFKPYKENGVSVPFVVRQNFSVSTNEKRR